MGYVSTSRLGDYMPFHLDISDGEPFEIRILENDLEILAIVPIGHDSSIDVQYNAIVTLIRLEPFDGDYKAELMFDIVEAAPEGSTYFYDGLDTEKFLLGGDREVVLEVICSATENIVAQRQPDAIVMSSFQTNLPDKALVKYMGVSNAIRGAGYEGGEGNTFQGQHIWMFVKR
jgi:hypothetical protein